MVVYSAFLSVESSVDLLAANWAYLMALNSVDSWVDPKAVGLAYSMAVYSAFLSVEN